MTGDKGSPSRTHFQQQEQPKFQEESLTVERSGQTLTVWNHVTVEKEHEVSPEGVETTHSITVPESDSDRPPEYITPAVAARLHLLDVYPAPEVINPTATDVRIV